MLSRKSLSSTLVCFLITVNADLEFSGDGIMGFVCFLVSCKDGHCLAAM